MAEKALSEGKESKKSKKIPLMAIMGFILLLNMLVMGKIFIGGGKAEKAKKSAGEEVGTKVVLEEFLVNLKGGNNFLKTTIALGLKKGITEEKIKENLPLVRDAAINTMSSKNVDEISSESGKASIKNELIVQINKELGEEDVAKIYFMDFATQ